VYDIVTRVVVMNARMGCVDRSVDVSNDLNI